MRYIVHVLQAASICALSTLLLSARQAEPAKQITETEIKRAINARSDVDECDSLDKIHIDHLEYYDFTRDGQPEGIVVASTCMTGTAGPDVHAVYTRLPDGTLGELPLLNAKGDPPWSDQENQPIPVFGNPNYTLTVDGGKLVVRWGDSSDRDQPLTVWYNWNGTKFVVPMRNCRAPFSPATTAGKLPKKSIEPSAIRRRWLPWIWNSGASTANCYKNSGQIRSRIFKSSNGNGSLFARRHVRFISGGSTA
jgi:hypothetical protein